MEKAVGNSAVVEWLNNPENFKIFITKPFKINHFVLEHVAVTRDMWEFTSGGCRYSGRGNVVLHVKPLPLFKRIWAFLIKERKWK